MAQADDIYRAKERFLLRREAVLKRKVTTLERQLFETIFESVIGQLELDSSGQIKASTKNTNLINRLDDVFDEFNNTRNAKVVSSFANDLLGVSDFNDRYFNTFEEDSDRFDKIRSRSQRIMLDRIGVNEDGALKKKGFLTDFINDTRVKNEVKKLAFNAVSGKASFQEFKEQLRQFVVSTDTSDGQLQAHYRAFAYDTFQEYDRIESEQYANDLKLQAFVYSGGLIRTTRRFCCQRNGKVWTREESERWPRGFPGDKPGRILNTLGGYYCRHGTKWISNEAAARRRSDLEVNKAGKLVSVPAAKKQRLNKC